MGSSGIHHLVIRGHNHTIPFEITDHFLNDLIGLFSLTGKYHSDPRPMFSSLDSPDLSPGIEYHRDWITPFGDNIDLNLAIEIPVPPPPHGGNQSAPCVRKLLRDCSRR